MFQKKWSKCWQQIIQKPAQKVVKTSPRKIPLLIQLLSQQNSCCLSRSFRGDNLRLRSRPYHCFPQSSRDELQGNEPQQKTVNVRSWFRPHKKDAISDCSLPCNEQSVVCSLLLKVTSKTSRQAVAVNSKITNSVRSVAYFSISFLRVWMDALQKIKWSSFTKSKIVSFEILKSFSVVLRSSPPPDLKCSMFSAAIVRKTRFFCIRLFFSNKKMWAGPNVRKLCFGFSS